MEQNMSSGQSKLVFVQVVGGNNDDIKNVVKIIGPSLEEHGLKAIISNENISIRSVDELIEQLKEIKKGDEE